MRRPLIAGNWKMNLTASEGVALVQGLKPNADVDVMVAPSFVNLVPVSMAAKNDNPSVVVAAQNVNAAESGAYTGEISLGMLTGIGIDVVIIGHSERRDIYSESNDMIREKVNAVVASDKTVILCMGEQLADREAGYAEKIVLNQLNVALSDVSADQMAQVVIAYEPVWAIGTGKTASSVDAEEMHKCIRTALADNFNSDVAESTRILYGGSVKPENIKELMSMDNIDGALVGGASLTSESFNQLINFL